MRYCPNCNINIEGAHKICPLCQNGLSGDMEESVYPSSQEFRKKSLLYKIQLFALITIMLVCIALDFVWDVRGLFHWSIIVIAWVIGGEMALAKLIHKHNNSSFVISHCAFWIALLVMITFIPIGYKDVYFEWILPAISIISEVLHFIFMLKDKAQNAMIYLLGSSGLGLIMAAVFFSVTKEKSILWIVVSLVSIICVVGAVIFKGKKVTSELIKRFHI